MSNLTERRDAAIQRKDTLKSGEKLTYEEQRAIAYHCDIDSDHDVGDYVALMHVTASSGAIIEPHRAKICWDCYIDQFTLCQVIDPDESNPALRACRIPADTPLPERGPVSFVAPQTLKQLLTGYTLEQISEAMAE